MKGSDRNLNEIVPRSNDFTFSSMVRVRDGFINIWFNDIETKIIQEISNDKVHFVKIICPYISSTSILKSLISKKGVEILTIRDRNFASKKRSSILTEISPLNKFLIHTLSKGRGRNKSILHMKCLILMDKNKIPIKAIYGSYNLTQNAVFNIESMMCLTDASTVDALNKRYDKIKYKCKKYILK